MGPKLFVVVVKDCCKNDEMSKYQLRCDLITRFCVENVVVQRLKK